MYYAYKGGETDEVKNYRSIVCLPMYYKLMTFILTNKIYDHMTMNNILLIEQKGVQRKVIGWKDHLMLDEIMSYGVNRNKISVRLIWINYKKKYNNIPHSWLIEAIKMCKIDDKVWKFIEILISAWQTKVQLPYYDRYISTDDIKIEREIF